MFTKLIRWFFGSRRYLVSPHHSDRAASLIMNSGAYFRKMKSTDKGLTFLLFRGDSPSVERIFGKYGIEFKMTRETGLHYLMERYRKRFGILVGAFLFAVIILASEKFIWNMNVTGNTTITADEIESRLASLGCRVGSYIPGIDFDKLQNEYLLMYGDTAWISVNLHGTVANVEVRESENPERAVDESIPYNLVAKEDGIVSYMEILRGKPIARENELVRKGELLASGIEDGKHGFMLVHARGKVLAEVKRNIRIEVPLEEKATGQTGRVYREKYLNIFAFSFKFSKSGGIFPAEYDTIESTRKLNVFGVVELPISVKTREFHEIAPVTVNYTPEEARKEAYRRLRTEMEACLKEGELAGRKISAGLVEEAYVIECELTLIADIAEKQPIYTE